MLEAPGVFHEGERSLHAMLGIGERRHAFGQKMIRDHMPDQHREFFETLSHVHLGATDTSGHPWAVTRTGPAGFMVSPDDRTLNVTSIPLSGEPQDLNIFAGAKVSIVGIEYETQRRNRLNATIGLAEDGTLVLGVDQSYGNCPKYIQIRNKVAVGQNEASEPIISATLDGTAKAQITAADTLLISSRAAQLEDDPRAGVDINHRGGMPGFVTVLDDSTLQFPDYKGNSFYNTFGNIVTDDRVGLQFVDFEDGTLLNIKGRAQLIEDLNDGALPLMGRGLRISVEQVVRAPGALPIRCEFIEFSDRNPAIAPETVITST
ncbi:pyridoxamine 5'-phosphate oxidase family protein [Tateyamaria sp. SN3-11]|uniref:pyridoxamine 5'-phosphate oxidase family protein n=1 Tax=Tateyamaria sp. SN3-11 TaxID=3092147 RepID=UPI0039E8573B